MVSILVLVIMLIVFDCDDDYVDAYVDDCDDDYVVAVVVSCATLSMKNKD